MTNDQYTNLMMLEDEANTVRESLPFGESPISLADDSDWGMKPFEVKIQNPELTFSAENYFPNGRPKCGI
jgi:hypothetical protein